MKLRTIKEIKNLKGKRVLLRLGLNAAIKNGKVVGGYRIKQVIPTIKYLKDKGAKVVILGHIGRDGKQSMKPVADYINRRTKTGFVPNLHDKNLSGILENMKEGTAMILGNLRSDLGEVSNSMSFAKYLASFGDVYVNDAFPVAHRKHASVVLLPKLLPGYIGFQFEREIKHLSVAMKPPRPFLFILGGAKPSTKIPLMKKFLKEADSVFVGGALANNFFKEMGYEIGRSLIEKGDFNLRPLLKNKKLVLPEDVVIENKKVLIKKPKDLTKNEIIADGGPETIKELEKLIKKSKFVLWNGPLGNYEKGYDKGTVDLLKILAKSEAKTIIGGGDTLTVAFNLKLHNKFTFVSTGGGAMLDFLADGKLPGIEAIRNSRK
ncbi:Phosphoglycerate kinase [hydrothermal vent metagenome]|uniref:phosphoglycerate kinase n=1 Tax=hydrothermal vent metagenome TaxID=652676 RepID=A0A3B0T1L0_9ZZZZ